MHRPTHTAVPYSSHQASFIAFKVLAAIAKKVEFVSKTLHVQSKVTGTARPSAGEGIAENKRRGNVTYDHISRDTVAYDNPSF
jgi:hypothetical protein